MVTILNKQRKIQISDEVKSIIEKTVERVLQQENFPDKASVSIVLMSNSAIKKLNFAYRNINDATDVLSFPMMDKQDDIANSNGEAGYNIEDGIVFLGDIVISVEKATEQSAEYGHSFEREIAFLVAHGMLHLLGYDHSSDDDTKEMRMKEESVLKHIGLNR